MQAPASGCGAREETAALAKGWSPSHNLFLHPTPDRSYIWPAHWSAPALLRQSHLADVPAEQTWWAGADSTYSDGARVTPPAPVPSPLVVPVNDGQRTVNAAVWCRLPVELRGLLRLRSLCRFAAKNGAGPIFPEWRLPATDNTLEIPPPIPRVEPRAPGDASFAALVASLASAGGGSGNLRARRLGDGATAADDVDAGRANASDYSSAAAAGRRRLLQQVRASGGDGAWARNQRQLARRRLRLLTLTPETAVSGSRRWLQEGVCLPAGAVPATPEEACTNPATGTDPVGWPPAAAGPKGASNTNLGLQLLDWLVWPAPPLKERLAQLLPAFRPGRQFVVGVHMRTGGSGIEGDAHIASPEALSPVAACCAGEAIRSLARTFGRREEVVLLVFSDSVAARLQVKGAFRGAVVAGMPVRVVDFGAQAGVVHTDLGVHGGEGGAEQVRASTIDAMVQHFLLSSAHALVRSRSGYSESAQAWGRVPLTLQLRFSSQTCEVVSRDEFRTMSSWERRRRLREEGEEGSGDDVGEGEGDGAADGGAHAAAAG